MAHIYGQIDTLKQIRNRLTSKSIYRFNSLHELDAFLENYESEKTAIYQHFEKEVDNDIFLLQDDIKYNNANLENTISENNIKLEAKVNRNLARIHLYKKSNQDSYFEKQIIWFVISFLKLKTNFIRFYIQYTLRYSIRKMKRLIKKDNALLNDYIANRDNIIDERSAGKIKQLAFTKEVVLGLNPLIAGAIGENLVVNEIKKLSDDYILINDFSLRFNPPIYNRKKNDRIYSIQIDHLLISKAGVFILETKNWSKESIQSLYMRSPIEQVNRSGYALFVLLNSNKSELNLKLNSHHWGRRNIPIRSIVVMINEKPEGEFMHVKVKSLKELNGYIEFFEPIFSDEEFDEISNGIIDLHNRENRV